MGGTDQAVVVFERLAAAVWPAGVALVLGVAGLVDSNIVVAGLIGDALPCPILIHSGVPACSHPQSIVVHPSGVGLAFAA